MYGLHRLRSLLVAEGMEAEGELSDQAARAVVDRLQAARSQAALLKERSEQERLKVGLITICKLWIVFTVCVFGVESPALRTCL